MRQPTEADIEAAKAYLRLRLEAEHSMVRNLESVMREAAERVVDVLYSAGLTAGELEYADLPLRVQWDINAVIDWLNETINDYFLTLALYEKEDNKDIILPLILGKNHGMTFEERLSSYCTKYRDELLLLVGAGLFLGLTKMTLAKSIGNHLKHPYKNPDLVEGIAAPLSYGRGRTNSMFTAISGLTTYGISQAWMGSQYINDRREGCVGWIVRRGSSIPCDICDSMVGFHDDESDLPPYHNSCCCLAIPITRD